MLRWPKNVIYSIQNWILEIILEINDKSLSDKWVACLGQRVKVTGTIHCPVNLSDKLLIQVRYSTVSSSLFYIRPNNLKRTNDKDYTFEIEIDLCAKQIWSTQGSINKYFIHLHLPLSISLSLKMIFLALMIPYLRSVFLLSGIFSHSSERNIKKMYLGFCSPSDCFQNPEISKDLVNPEYILGFFL